MAVQVLLPKLGLTMETGSIEEWLVEPGTAVTSGRSAACGWPPTRSTSMSRPRASGLFHPVADLRVDLPPGTLIGWLLAEGESLPDGGAARRPRRSAPPADAPSRSPWASRALWCRPAPTSTRRRRRPMARATGGRLFVSPNARRVATERGVDVTTLRGTGPNGRIVTADVLEAQAAPAQPRRRRRGRLTARAARRSCGRCRPRRGRAERAGRADHPVRHHRGSSFAPGELAAAPPAAARGHPADRHARRHRRRGCTPA